MIFFLSGSFWTFLGGRSWFSWLLNFDDRGMDRGFCRVGLAAMLPLFHEQDFAEPDGIVPPNCSEDLTIPLAI